jgi:hypothetical protein
MKLYFSLRDNGTFETRMRQMIHQIRDATREARAHEGRTSNDANGWVEAFDKWQPVYQSCSQFDEQFYRHTHLDWAKKKSIRISLQKFVLSVIVAALVGAFIKEPLADLLKWGYHEIAIRAHWTTEPAVPSPSPSPP